MERLRLSLFELNSIVREVISMSLPDSYWVEAELSEAREGYGGHCYLELIEKEERSNTPIAKAHASCWRNRWMFIKPNFERITGQRIHAGMKVLLKVHAQFHENYGFSWIVDDIDPNYTMGDMARKRLEIINTLKAEGVFELQKELALPMFCQRIAVISSATAAGYGDFCNQLADNDYGLQFQTRLFPATMQGEGVEQSVIAALDSINAEWEQFDCVVIIRGGGATSDLSGFDTLALAENVANFPLPIITGIGHERDESVLDMISFQRVKTPTAAAAFLVNHLTEVYARVVNAQGGYRAECEAPSAGGENEARQIEQHDSCPVFAGEDEAGSLSRPLDEPFKHKCPVETIGSPAPFRDSFSEYSADIGKEDAQRESSSAASFSAHSGTRPRIVAETWLQHHAERWQKHPLCLATEVWRHH